MNSSRSAYWYIMNDSVVVLLSKRKGISLKFYLQSIKVIDFNFIESHSCLSFSFADTMDLSLEKSRKSGKANLFCTGDRNRTESNRPNITR